MLKLAALVGPTAVGKTTLSVGIALQLNAEIISCDSMQIYKGMDIGTAKAGAAERVQTPHHMLDLVEPDVNFTVADYQHQVKPIIQTLNEKGKLPLLVGGTGLYYQAVVDNYDFYPLDSVQAVRRKWEEICREKGIDYVYEQVLKIDREYALLVGGNDKKRLIRALEVYELAGQPFSQIQRRNQHTYNLAVVGLHLNRPELYRRIDQRVDEMIAAGLIDEVLKLKGQGYPAELKSMQGLGYRQAYAYLNGILTHKEMVNEIKRETRHFAKRQYTWFNKDKRIHWIDISEYEQNSQLMEEISYIIEGHLAKL